MAVQTTLQVLADLHLQFGLIDVSEHRERFLVADWVANDEVNGKHPRDPIAEIKSSEGDSSELVVKRCTERNNPTLLNEPERLEFLAFNKWVFTRSDADPYPSTPHGHLQDPNRSWPKLNPYTGRVFKAKYQEDSTQRLSKKQMRTLWDSQDCRDFCRSHIVWYMEAHSHHKFAVRYPLRFPYWG